MGNHSNINNRCPNHTHIGNQTKDFCLEGHHLDKTIIDDYLVRGPSVKWGHFYLLASGMGRWGERGFASLPVD